MQEDQVVNRILFFLVSVGLCFLALAIAVSHFDPLTASTIQLP